MEEEAPNEYGYERVRANLAESGVGDRSIRDLGIGVEDLMLSYGEHQGNTRLRELIASQGGGVTKDDVLVTAGAAGALFIMASSLLERGDHLVVVHPNYATNIDTPTAIGCNLSKIELRFENRFELDVKEVEKAVTPNTVYISLTCPHNPTGTMMSMEDIKKVIEIAEKNDCWVLVDETYRDISYGEPYPTAASLSDRVVAVASVSKAYGVPGIRIGWLITRNKKLYKNFLAAKEQIGICGSIVDETIAAHVLEERDEWLAKSRAKNRRRLSIVSDWVTSETYVEWIKPTGGVVCFPRLKVDDDFDFDRFYKVLLEDFKTYVGPGYWFAMPKRYFRIGFSWPEENQLREGLSAVSEAIREVVL